MAHMEVGPQKSFFKLLAPRKPQPQLQQPHPPTDWALCVHWSWGKTLATFGTRTHELGVLEVCWQWLGKAGQGD